MSYEIVQVKFKNRLIKSIFHLSLPWDQHTPVGYFLEICFDIIGGDVFFASNGWEILLFISICLYHQAFYKIFQHSVKKLDRPHKGYHKYLGNLVEFHNLVKEYAQTIIPQFICNSEYWMRNTNTNINISFVILDGSLSREMSIV